MLSNKKNNKNSKPEKRSEKLDSFDEFMKNGEDDDSSLFGKKNMSEKNTKQPRQGHDIPLGFYRRIAFGFIIITGVLLVFMLVFSATNATIEIEPKKEQISVSLLRTVNGTTDRIDGAVFVDSIDFSKKYSVIEGKEVEGHAGGKMKIFNKSKETMSLIPKTRFQSESGVIFRITSRIDIKPGQEIVADVVADVLGKSGEVEKGTFIIPGLPKDMQDRIYGESMEAMTGGTRVAGILNEADVAAAEDDMIKIMKTGQLEKYKSEASAQTYTDSVIDVEVLEKAIDKKVGDEVVQFTLTAKIRVTAVFYDGSALDTLTRQAVFAKVPDDKRLHTVGDPTFDVEKVDKESKTATLKLSRDGLVTIDPSSSSLAPEKFVNSTIEGVGKYLESLGLVDSWSVSIRPKWRNKTPSSSDRIKVKVNIE